MCKTMFNMKPRSDLVEEYIGTEFINYLKSEGI